MKTVREVSLERIAAVTTGGEEDPKSLFNQLVNTFADREVRERADTVEKAILLSEKMSKELKGYRPDQVFFDSEGKESSSQWSKAKIEAKQKLEKSLRELNEAIEKVFTETDGYNRLKQLYTKLAQQNQSQGGGKGQGEATSSNPE